MSVTRAARTPRVGVVVATRNRCESLLHIVQILGAMPEPPPVVVVDNASQDDSVERLCALACARLLSPATVGGRPPRRGEVAVLALAHNHGAAARTLGARALETPYVAFSDDDSWWAPGALERAAKLLDEHPRLALVAGRVLVGAEQRMDPTCTEMARSPLTGFGRELPGPAVLGFVACGAVLRRRAFLEVGGFEPRLGLGGEEQLLAMDLAAAGWDLAYVEDVVAHHHPASGARAERQTVMVRNGLWSTWLRRPPARAAAQTVSALRLAGGLPEARRGLVEAVRGLRWVARKRRVVPPLVEADLRLLESAR